MCFFSDGALDAIFFCIGRLKAVEQFLALLPLWRCCVLFTVLSLVSVVFRFWATWGSDIPDTWVRERYRTIAGTI